MRHREHELQVASVRWFRLQYPEYAPLLFAVPNGGARDKREGVPQGGGSYGRGCRPTAPLA